MIIWWMKLRWNRPPCGRQSPSVFDKWHSRTDTARHTRAFDNPVTEHWAESRRVQFRKWNSNRQHIGSQSNVLPTEPTRPSPEIRQHKREMCSVGKKSASVGEKSPTVEGSWAPEPGGSLSPQLFVSMGWIWLCPPILWLSLGIATSPLRKLFPCPSEGLCSSATVNINRFQTLRENGSRWAILKLRAIIGGSSYRNLYIIDHV